MNKDRYREECPLPSYSNRIQESPCFMSEGEVYNPDMLMVESAEFCCG